ncbi:Glutathione import ATP-binding protein GsiA [Thalassovita gelatinovora]|uniref:Glutathione import ATP-binding protein GsiA n=1 Tax=Thalassovita gelatinovora TaxID=53501 RepID=A0A0P1FBE6_THAGE|nr:ABC transporter ATP-binding protein [Thalassovita gelatinovora]QIZ80746.1 ABC transporter ATP-binding protein [Thalassovita gelatinovora]CUH65377.1 Glutathione import ATP-binding protein GsiA [Thalassovita gelatinovora]SEQ90190.1 peptide/nickel transport system ATP-binding protein [Thalassovita gelatinovora]
MSLLSIENLSLSIHGAPILRDVSMQIEPGRILGVIGESGSGKSMTAFAAMQLLPDGSVCDGRIELNGQEVLDLGEQDLCRMRGRDVGMVFQEPMTALNPIRTIGDQVAETILIHEKVSRGAAMERAAEALRRAELPQDRFPLSRYPFELSGGQRQRVVIAMAIALRPKLLIADEPTTALDVTTQAQILDLLKRLVAEDGMGLMLISHDLAVVADLADDIVIMRKGEVVESGPADSLFRTMQHPYSKALLAASTHAPDREGAPQDVPLLQVQDVVRDYTVHMRGWWGKTTTFQAVKGVSFEIRKGESLGLVGESGCGKSTLTRAILGLEEVQGGSILLDGQPVFTGHHANRDIRRRMQVVFQDPYGSFNPRWKVGRLIAEPYHLLEQPPAGRAKARAIAEALESVGLQSEDQHKYIHEFSGGQRQRIAIARALIIKPELIILDEAVSALDVSVRAQVLDLLADLGDRFGLTYLFISHDLSVVRNVTDRVLVMKAGEIVEQGETKAVFDAPQHEYTKQLIEAAPVLPADVA